MCAGTVDLPSTDHRPHASALAKDRNPKRGGETEMGDGRWTAVDKPESLGEGDWIVEREKV